jgi:DNA-binding transcriptional regulator GbsR (MarR family)
MNERSAIDRFVDAWGEMGRIWGIPRTHARIHARLLATDDALSLDAIVAALSISKGGASMALRDLRSWGIVRRADRPGDRRDFHVAEGDVWSSFAAMVRARKGREFDPAAADVRNRIAELFPETSDSIRERLGQMVEILDTLDGLGERLLKAGPSTRAVLRFLAGLAGRSLPT